MYKADLYFEGDFFNILVDIIKEEEGIIMYWCIIYGKEIDRLYCIRVGDEPLMITNSTITNLNLGKSVLNCIDEIEYAHADNGHNSILQSS